MQMDRFTIKAQESLQGAQAVAGRFSHQEIDCEHLVLALLEQPEGLTGPLLQKLGVQPDALAADIEKELARRAKVQGSTSSDAYPGSHLKKALDAAQSEAAKLRDEYTSTEHLLLGVLSQGGAELKRIFQSRGLKQDA